MAQTAAVIDLTAPLDLDQPAAQDFLAAIQGNILKGHGRDQAIHLFVRFGNDSAKSRGWIAAFAANHLTTAAAQSAQTLAKKAKGDGAPFAMIALSRTGMDRLGVAAADLPADADFRKGLKASDLKNTDPPVTAWEQPYQGDVHAIVILADENPARLADCAAALSAALNEAGASVHSERGDAIIAQDPQFGQQNLVHFGFADGLSQPELIKQDIEKAAAENGNDQWDPAAPLSLLFRPDPGGYGSYLVFRKLEQNVRGFYQAERQIVTAFGLTGDKVRTVEAMIVGRYRNGQPAVAPPAVVDPAVPGNNFNFDNDRFGVTCPFHAHIRRTNPRGDLSSPGIVRPVMPRDVERGLRIARRGIPYGCAAYRASPDISSYPDAGVGLLFMSFQARLFNFEIQQGGSDDNDFPMPQGGVDATIGRSADPVPQHWFQPADTGVPADGPVSPAGELRFTMANFVTLKGGEYFYAPSPGFLHRIAAGQ